jgi:hypothetical protein
LCQQIAITVQSIGKEGMVFHSPSPLRCVVGVLFALLLASVAIMSTWFDDASGASDFGSSMYIAAPWAGEVWGNVRFLDLDADGIEEIIVGGTQIQCHPNLGPDFTSIEQLALFRRDSITNQYAQLNYGQQGVFLGINFYAFNFERLGRHGSTLPDIIACQLSTTKTLAVLENHGGLNFSISGVAFSSAVSCNGPLTVIAVADTDKDGSDEAFVSSTGATNFYTRLMNTTLIAVDTRFSPLTIMSFAAGTFADLDGDSYVDLIWIGSLNSSFYPAYIFRNVDGNFSSVANSIDGVRYGSIVVADFTGDNVADVVLSGQLSNGSGSLSLYEQISNFSFVRRSDAGFPAPSSVWYNVAALKQDLVIVPSTRFMNLSVVSVYLNNGHGIFSPLTASWLPTEFRGEVVRGPDVGASPSFLAVGRTSSRPYDGSTLSGYVESGGTLVSYANTLFGSDKKAYSLLYGVIAVADFNYDGCTDAFLSGDSYSDDSFSGGLFAGDCSGSLGIQSVDFPVHFATVVLVRDFDHDGLLELFFTGPNFTNMYEVFYYRFNAGGGVEDLSSTLPSLDYYVDFACAGAASGSNFDDIFLSRVNVITHNVAQELLRNARNGSFIVASADLFGIASALYGSCTFASGGADASTTWMDIFSVGQDYSVNVFNYLKNNRNGTLTNLANSLVAFPGGKPKGCTLSSMVAADFNGDGRDDLFYNGHVFTSIIGSLYLRDANGSMILSTGLEATGNLTELFYSSSVAADIDSDGDIDLVVAGYDITEVMIMAALLNDGSGNFVDETAQVFGSIPAFANGAIAIAQLTGDSKPDLINVGTGLFCGPRVFLQNDSSPSSSTTSSMLPPLASDASSLDGTITGGLGFLLLLFY